MKPTFIALVFLFLAGCVSPTQDASDQGSPSVAAKTSPPASLTVGQPSKRPGEMLPLLGLSLRDPENRDADGWQIPESDQYPTWLNLPKGFIRHPAGSQSFKITSIQDPGFLYARDVILKDLPESVSHDFTWPPQLPVDQVSAWVTSRTGRICLGNEPPNHIPTKWADGVSYVQWASTVYAQNPVLRDRMWIQSGKPEVLRYSTDPLMLSKHRSVWDATAAAVKSGALPARIVTTHKIFPEFPADLYGFYRQLLDDYANTYGPDVKVCFQEWNYADADELTADVIPTLGAFLCVMSRLKSEQGDQVSGAAYQQGFAVGNTNLIGTPGLPRANPGAKWTAGAVADFWQLFGDVMASGDYVSSKIANKPDGLYFEIFDRGGKRYAIAANTSDVDILLEANATRITWIDPDGTSRAGRYRSRIPAKSAGVLEFSAPKIKKR